MTPDPTTPVDPWGQAAKVVENRAATFPGTTPAAPAAPPRQPIPGVPGPWPQNGKKYPNALDYSGSEGSARWSHRLGLIGAPDGLADKTGFSAALYATEVYYLSRADVHPLIQLGVTGAAFGGAWAKAYFEQRQAAPPAADAPTKSRFEKLGKAKA